jgi:thiamine pyrophosphokinase
MEKGKKLQTSSEWPKSVFVGADGGSNWLHEAPNERKLKNI